MIRVPLSPAEADRLDSLFRSTDDRILRRHLQIMLMGHLGVPDRTALPQSW